MTLLTGMALGALLASPAAAREWRTLGDGLPSKGQWRQGFDIADMNGDGRLDIVHGPSRRGDGRPVVFLGDGAGGFTIWREARFPDLPFDYGDVVAADFTGDGWLDLGLGSHLRGLSVLRSDGTGGFERWDQGLRLDTSGEAFASRALATADWNLDGKPDLLALGEGPSPGGSPSEGSWGLRVFLNGGDGTWSEHQPDEPGRIFGYSLAVGNYDNDRRPDAVTSSRSQGRLDVVHTALADGGVARGPLRGARPRSILHAVTMHDFDGDGAGEVVASYLVRSPTGKWQAGVDIYPSAKAVTDEREEVLVLPDSIEISLVAVGDLDADGRGDLVAAGADGGVWIFKGGRQGGFKRIAAAKIQRSSGNCKASHAAFADLDGEPGDELVISFSSEPVGEETCPSGGSIQVWQLR